MAQRRRKAKITLAPVFDQMTPAMATYAQISPVDVDDPRAPAGEKPEKVTVMRNTRDDPLGFMHARRQVDETQYQAGRKWQELYSRAAIGGVRAMDPAKEYVSGGAAPDILSDAQMMAIRALKKADVEMGKLGASLVHSVLGDGRTVYQFAADNGEASERAALSWAFMLAKMLDTLAVEFGMAMAPYLRKSQKRS